MAVFPGPGTAPLSVPVGYLNAPGYPGSLTTFSGDASNLTPGQTYSFYLFPDGLNGIAAAGVTFIGCCFQSNAVSDANVAGSNATGAAGVAFSYCTFEPQPAVAPSPPVAYGKGYQYGIDQRGISGLTVDHCDFWGFANGIQLSASSQVSPVVITWNFFHDPSADGGGIYHVDGILSSDGGPGIEYVTVSNNTIAAVANTNAAGFQVPASGQPYSHITITNNYFSGFNIMVDVGTGHGSDHVTFTGNVWGADFEPANAPLYSEGFVVQPGSSWHGNTIFVPSASPLRGADSSWMAAGNSGLFWWPGDQNPSGSTQIVGHPGDFTMTWTLVNDDTATFADGNAGHVYTLPSGAPSAGQLDVLCVNSDTLVSTPSTTGAAWTLGPTFVGNQGAYLWYRKANGSEGATVTITTSGNFPTQVSWSRWGGESAADVNAVAHVDANDGTTTPAVSTGTLAATGELVVAFAALHGLHGAGTQPSAPSWSTGYTGMTSDFSGVTTADVAAFTAYNTSAGTASESPNVTWTNNIFDRYILVQTFTAAAPPPPGGGKARHRTALPALIAAL